MTLPDVPVIEDVMARLVAGDTAAYAELNAAASAPIRGIVLGDLQSKGLWLDRDRLDDIVADAVLELARVAHAWRPDGGASPWQWARRRILSTAYATLGQLTDALDERHHDLSERPARMPDVDVLAAFYGLAGRHARTDLLRRALDTVASERDRRIWLEVVVEEYGGNRAPSVTVGAQNGLSSTNVRKICQRVRQRLRRLAEEDEAFGSLRAEPALAA